jgi:hypothetical protein
MTRFALNRPKTVLAAAVVLTLAFAAQFPRIAIDTDPENMLEPDQADRVYYDRVKEEFGIRDLIVVGIVDPETVFRPEALEQIARATDEILRIRGVIIPDVVSLTTTDNVKSSGGLLDVRPVMPAVPRSEEALEQLRADIAENPFLADKIASSDGTAVALYVPIERKDMSYRIAGEIREIMERQLLPGQSFHLAGLPVAEDTFGHEMFVQMAIVAPATFIVILVLVFLMFRSAVFLVPVGLDAMFAVIWAMGLLIGTGQTVHIMSSMIPVFLMPIAILDDVHVLSGFFDRYRALYDVGGDRRQALLEGMRPLYRPMLFTSLTSAAGFASLALADIPPVRVFGLFVAFGILAAWLFSMTMVPAIISLVGEKHLAHIVGRMGGKAPVLDRVLGPVGRFASSRARTVLVLSIALLVAGALGVARIRVNDNPVNWFNASHPMRLADTAMNRLFGGTYMAYAVVEGAAPDAMKDPDALGYIARMQSALEKDPLVGKTSSVADIVTRINLVLHDGDPGYDRLPDSGEAAGQFLFLFQSSGDPDDLDNFLDPDASRANVWVQMKGGDNQQMQAIEDRLAAFIAADPPPAGLTVQWSGLTYINKVWQDLMVVGMLKAVAGGIAVVFLLMWLQFRSLRTAVLSMVPLLSAILFSYGLIGWAGKDYDMPIAVCSSLSLGLGIDFAIHFLQRFREHFAASGDAAATHQYMFGEPGRAIARNAVVISVGFLPLIASPLTPYVTVGLFFALLMGASTVATLLILPAALAAFEPKHIFGGFR